jgi:hypothetical protein
MKIKENESINKMWEDDKVKKEEEENDQNVANDRACLVGG